MTVSADQLPSWRETSAKQAIVDFVAAVTDPDGPDFVPEPDRVAVFDNDGTLWTEQPVYAQLVFAIDRAADLGHPTSLEKLQAGGMAALIELVTLTHTGITTEEFGMLCRSWLASARHPRFGRPYPETVYQPMLELLGLLGRNGFSCWIFSGGGTDFMRAWTTDVHGLPPHRVIGSVGERVPHRPRRSRAHQGHYHPDRRRRAAKAELHPPAYRAAADFGRREHRRRPGHAPVDRSQPGPDPGTGRPSH